MNELFEYDSNHNIMTKSNDIIKRICTYIILIVFIILCLLPFLCSAQSRYEVKCPQILIDRSYQYLVGEVGKLETGNNRGIADIYNKTIGNPLGSSYCQAGQYWTYWMSCQDFNLSFDLIPMYRNGMAYSTYLFGTVKGHRTTYIPEVNDFIVWKAKTNSTGHIERIIGIGNAGWVTTIGFNCGSPEGVHYKKRNIYFPLNRIKYIKGLIGVKN
jgi:hypothetical protein